MAVRMQFEISGDSSPLAKAIMDAMKTGQAVAKAGGQVAGSQFGKEFGSQVKGAVMNVLGAGAIIGAIKKQFAEATKISAESAKAGLGVEAWQELQRAAEIVGMTVEELQQAAPVVAEEFQKLMEAVKSDGGILDKETVETLADASADLASVSKDLAPGIALLARVVSLAMGATKANVEKQVGVGAYLAGRSLPGTEIGQTLKTAGMEMVTEANPFSGKDRNALRTAGQDFREQYRKSAEEQRSRRDALVSSFATLGTAGASRDMQLMGSMVPGMNSDLVEQMRRAVTKLESIDQNLR